MAMPTSLAPNSAAVTFTVKKTINAAITSTPTVKYSYTDYSDTLSKTLPSLNFDLASVNLQNYLDADNTTVDAGKSTNLICTITNKSNVTLKNISIYDHTGQLLGATAATLAPGQNIIRNRSITPTQTAQYTFRITYTDPADSTKLITESTNALKVTVKGSTAPVLTLKATADPTSLKDPGDVKFQIRVTNENSFAVDSITIKESSSGQLKTIDPIAPNGEVIVEFTVKVNASANILFTASIPNSQGSDYLYYSNTLAITVDNPATVSDTPAITDTPGPTATPVTPPVDVIKILLWTLGGILALVMIATAALIIINIMQKKQAARDITVKRKIRD